MDDVCPENVSGYIVLYFPDCYLPLPEGYTGYTARGSESPAALNYILGSCGGFLTNYLGMVGMLGNAVGEIAKPTEK